LPFHLNDRLHRKLGRFFQRIPFSRRFLGTSVPLYCFLSPNGTCRLLLVQTSQGQMGGSWGSVFFPAVLLLRSNPSSPPLSLHGFSFGRWLLCCRPGSGQWTPSCSSASVFPGPPWPPLRLTPLPCFCSLTSARRLHSFPPFIAFEPLMISRTHRF